MFKNIASSAIPFEQQAAIITHAAPAADDFGAMTMLYRRAKFPQGVHFLSVHTTTTLSQMQYWHDRQIPVIDVGPLKYKNAGFASAAESIAHRCIETTTLSPDLFHQVPLSPNERQLLNILNENNDSGMLKRMRHVAFAYFIREIFSIFPQRETEIIERGVELVNAWIDLRDDEGNQVEEALRKGFQHVRTIAPAVAKRFQEGYAKGILTIGQLLATLGYYAANEVSGAQEELASAINFWTEMADGILKAEAAAADMVREKRGISIVPIRPLNRSREPMDFVVNVATYKPTKEDAHLARFAAKLIFEIIRDVDVLIMETPDGNVNIRYNRDGLRRDFDISRASTGLFQILENHEAGRWYRQAETNVILNGSIMAPAKPTEIPLERLLRWVATYLGHANLSYLDHLETERNSH